MNDLLKAIVLGLGLAFLIVLVVINYFLHRFTKEYEEARDYEDEPKEDK